MWILPAHFLLTIVEIPGALVVSPVFIVLLEFAVDPLKLGPRPRSSIC
jgi:hypothetical protein